MEWPSIDPPPPPAKMTNNVRPNYRPFSLTIAIIVAVISTLGLVAILTTNQSHAYHGEDFEGTDFPVSTTASAPQSCIAHVSTTPATGAISAEHNSLERAIHLYVSAGNSISTIEQAGISAELTILENAANSILTYQNQGAYSTGQLYAMWDMGHAGARIMDHMSANDSDAEVQADWADYEDAFRTTSAQPLDPPGVDRVPAGTHLIEEGAS